MLRPLVYLFLASALTVASRAQEVPPVDRPDPDDLAHGVARISLLNGDVSIRRGSGDVVAAAVNAPLMAQDAVQTGQGSRSEVQFDFASRLRIAAGTDIRIAELTADRFQIQLARGTTTLSVTQGITAQIEIDTPSVAIHPSGSGDFRITVLENGTTQITARIGELQVYTPRGTEKVFAGQTMLARGAAENPEFQMVSTLAQDEWDEFNLARNHDLANSESARNVSRDIPGSEDLDSYGHWVNDPTYGSVWAPEVAPGWAPYRAGRWAWEDYYGWTWVSTDPWGWAPYHYGNWFYGTAGWCWYPGVRGSRHFYRPALVGFFGYGVGVGVGFGNVGWVPLAPFEVFHPWYGRSGRGGFTTQNLHGAFRNARFPNAVSGISSRDFAQGHFGKYANPSAAQLAGAGVFHGNVPFTANSNHSRYNDRAVPVGRSSAFSPGTRFANHVAAPVQPKVSDTGSSWNRFGSPVGGPAGRGTFAGSAGMQQSQSSWNRFGAPAGGSVSSQRLNTPAGNVYLGNPAGIQFGSRPVTSRPPSSYGSGTRAVQVAPPVVQQRRSAPAYRPSLPGRPVFTSGSSGNGGSNRPAANGSSGKSSGAGRSSGDHGGSPRR